jgi:hypothetical protein
MRALMAIVIFVGGLVSLDSMADAARKSRRSAKPPPQQHQKVDIACEARARHEDPSGDFAGYPCWAREALARGRNIDNR